jgi:hypothetical protein
MTASYSFENLTTQATDSFSISGQANDSANATFASINADSVYMSTTGDSTTLTAEFVANTAIPEQGAPEELQASGNGDILATNGTTNVEFINSGTNTSDFIDASTASPHFADEIVNFHSGDAFLLIGFPTSGAITTPFPAGMTVTDTPQGASALFTFPGGQQGTVLFAGVTSIQLAADFSASMSFGGTTASGIPFLGLTAA